MMKIVEEVNGGYQGTPMVLPLSHHRFTSSLVAHDEWIFSDKSYIIR